MRARKYSGSLVRAEMSLWDEIDVSEFSEEERQIYRNRRMALRLYQDESNPTEYIQTITGVGRAELVRLFERGMKRDDSGIPYGYNAIIPNNRLTEKNPSKMQRLMNDYQGLESKIKKFYFDSMREGRAYKHATKVITFKLFIEEIINRGADMKEYPFTSQDNGRRAFEKWLDEVETDRQLFLSRQKKDAQIEHKSVGTFGKLTKPTRPLSAVQIDGHRIDALYVVPIKYQNGETGYKVVTRPWLITALDPVTRCVLSYTITYEEEYSADDVLYVIEHITRPMEPYEGVREDMLPSSVFEEARYALPEVFYFDNALQHYALLLQNMKPIFGYGYCYGPAATPTGRPEVERYFGTFEKRFGHGIPSTTGSGKDDPVRIKAEQDAIRFAFTRENLEELVALSVAEYNNSPHSGLGGMTPMGKMRELIGLGIIPNRLHPSLRDSFRLWDFDKAVIRGSKEQGKRPYIQKENFRYTGECIWSQYEMLGEELTLHIFPDNILVIQAYYKGRYLGPLYIKHFEAAMGGRLSRRQARKLNRYFCKNNIPRSHGLDDVAKYILSLKEDASKRNVKDLNNIYYELMDITGEYGAPKLLSSATLTVDKAEEAAATEVSEPIDADYEVLKNDAAPAALPEGSYEEEEEKEDMRALREMYGRY